MSGSTPFHATIAQEIIVDPAAMGYKNQDETWKTDATILSLMTNKIFEKTDPLQAYFVRNWMAINGSLERLEDSLMEEPDGINPVRGIAVALRQIFREPGQTIDLDDQTTYDMFSILRVTGILSQEQFDRLVEISAEAASRADIIGVSEVQLEHILQVRTEQGQ